MSSNCLHNLSHNAISLKKTFIRVQYLLSMHGWCEGSEDWLKLLVNHDLCVTMSFWCTRLISLTISTIAIMTYVTCISLFVFIYVTFISLLCNHRNHYACPDFFVFFSLQVLVLMKMVHTKKGNFFGIFNVWAKRVQIVTTRQGLHIIWWFGAYFEEAHFF